MFGRNLGRSAILIASLVAIAACGGVTGVDETVVVTPPTTNPLDPEDRTPALLVPVSGDSQSTLVNRIAPQRLVVRVVDTQDRPVKNVPVSWVVGGDGIVTPISPGTDENGEASATWQLGDAPGNQFVRAEAGTLRLTFTAVATLEYTSVDAGGYHSCAITPSAAVYCWGYNGDGQLGVGSQANRNVPTPLSTDLTFRQLSGGRYHTCGITLAGIAYCWGANVDGRLGTNDVEPSAIPRQTSSPVAFDEIASGWNHTCGLSKAGLAYCWGFNQEGEVGAKIPPAESIYVAFPRPVSGQSFKKLAVGGLHSCAIDLQNDAWCWGLNNYGQLGDGTTQWTLNNTEFGGVPVPVQMPAAAGDFDEIAAGAYHSCALADGEAWCWGDNRSGQLGDDSNMGSLTPVAVKMPSGVTFTSISGGDTHTCAVATDGAAYCWGDNSFGQFGDGSTGSSKVPVRVAAGLTFRTYSAGETLSCGITTAGRVYCAGNNLYGQLGDATNENRTTPVKGAYQP